MRSNGSSKRRKPTAILLSIKPEFAYAILEGRKGFEFRRRLFREETVERVVVYASSPVQRVVGEFKLAAVHSLPLKSLWRRTQHHAGIERRYFDRYFEDCEVGHALEVGSSVLYEDPVRLEDAVGLKRPPQSFCYVD